MKEDFGDEPKLCRPTGSDGQNDVQNQTNPGYNQKQSRTDKLRRNCPDLQSKAGMPPAGFTLMPLPPSGCKVYTPPSLAEAMVAARSIVGAMLSGWIPASVRESSQGAARARLGLSGLLDLLITTAMPRQLAISCMCSMSQMANSQSLRC